MNKSKLVYLLIISSLILINTLEGDENRESMTYEEYMELINTPDFKEFIEQYENDEIILEASGGDECLMPKNDAVNILSESYGISNSNPDDNLRFILGKCNPILLVPGIYATKLVVELQCKNIATEERKTTLKNLRLYCGDSLCKDETVIKEEHPLFVALNDPAFTILGTENDKYSTCLAFIMNYFQNENECPKVNNNNICYYSKYIKVGFYGGTDGTKKDGKCGVEALQNMIQTGSPKLDEILSMGAAGCYRDMVRALKKRGYREGFSLAGIPNDYRRFLATNNFATKVFERQVNELYSNTGKPVVIVAHSFGTLLTLTNLIKKKSDKPFLQKIKKFIAAGPPFSGSSKLLDAFLHGLNDWNKGFDYKGKKITLTNYNIFGQLLMYKTLPTIAELRPLPIAAKLLYDNAYSELGTAIKERLEIERNCFSKECDTNYIKSKSAKFDALFKGYFPSFTEDDCAYESRIDGNTNTLNRKCFTGIYDVGNCPTIISKSLNPTQEELMQGLYCNKFGSDYYYQGDCTDKKRNCIDEMYYSNKCPNVFNNKEAVNYLLTNFNENYSSPFGNLNKNVFESYSDIKEGVRSTISRQTSTSLIKDLPVPPVDTDLVYASFSPTIAALALDDDFTKDGKILKGWGDGTVPSWSSILTGLKWIYDKKKNNLPQKIRLIEYCSRLFKSDKYNYDPNKDQNFAALKCACLNSNNEYYSVISSCNHAGMIGTKDFIDYVISISDDPKEEATVTTSKRLSARNYRSTLDYENICNNALFDLLNTAK